MQTIKEMIQQIQTITYDAYKSSSQAAALLKTQAGPPEAMAKALERTAAQMEQSTVELRALCERCLPDLPAIGQKPALPALEVAGSINRNELGWLLIELNTLLPHCRFSTPLWLTDTITRLLDQHERRHDKLPMLNRALLVIEEFCDMDSRQVYDEDNKGWKAVSNAIKGRLVADDEPDFWGLFDIDTLYDVHKCGISLLGMFCTLIYFWNLYNFFAHILPHPCIYSSLPTFSADPTLVITSRLKSRMVSNWFSSIRWIRYTECDPAPHPKRLRASNSFLEASFSANTVSVSSFLQGSMKEGTCFMIQSKSRFLWL